MDCVGCGSAAVTERPDLTAQGYRRFRCRDCGKQFNERSDGVLNRASLPSDIIAFVVFFDVYTSHQDLGYLTKGRTAGWTPKSARQMRVCPTCPTLPTYY